MEKARGCFFSGKKPWVEIPCERSDRDFGEFMPPGFSESPSTPDPLVESVPEPDEGSCGERNKNFAGKKKAIW